MACLGCVYTSSSWINVSPSLVGRTIHIESLSQKGTWVDSYRRPFMMFHATRERDVYYKNRVKFLVKFFFVFIWHYAINCREDLVK